MANRTLVDLPARLISRWARYLLDVRDLTLEGSAEPRRWIGCTERFWIGVAADTGDWLRLVGSGDQAPVAPALSPASPVRLLAGQRTLELSIEVPVEAFALLDSADLRLRPSPLQCGDDAILLPGRNLGFFPPTVSQAERFAKLRLFDLPNLESGMELRGVVWAERPPDSPGRPRAPLPVAALHLLVH